MKKILTATALSLCFAVPALAQETGFQSAISSHNAQKAGGVVTQPKIRPDGGVYHLHGRVEMVMDGEDAFIAKLTPSRENEALYNAVQKSRGDYSVNYFYVTLPGQIAEYFYDNASIGEGFDLVGSYDANSSYQTVSGQEKTAAVFNAKYLELWDAGPMGPQAALSNENSSGSYSANYYACMDSASVQVFRMIDCAMEELDTQEAKLEEAYKRAGAAAVNVDATQKAWLKNRDRACPLDEGVEDRGSIMEHYDCLLRLTAAKVGEINALAG